MSRSSYEVVARGVAIYKQQTSRFWWCSITIEEEGRKEYKRFSTKKIERLEAIERAIEIKLELKIKKNNNIPLSDNAPTFQKICKILIAEYDKKERQRSTYKTYKLHWNRMIDFFNHKRIDNITSFNIIEYFDKYKISSKTQITTARTSFKKVYEYALYRNLIRKMDIPELPNIEKKTEVERDYFDKKDMEIFFNKENQRRFIENSRKAITEEIRRLFFVYCKFIWKTGIRPGTESQNIKYRNFYFGEERNIEAGHWASKRELFLKIEEGKVAEKQKRTIPLSVEIDYIFIELDLMKKTDSMELIESRSRKFLFRVNQNKEVNFIDTMNQYKAFLSENCNYDIGENKSLYSFRHTYITEKLLKNIDIHTIAKATGTSTAMIDKHYSKLTAILKKDELTNIL